MPQYQRQATQPDPEYLAYHSAPSVPAFTLPDGAVDAHCHVFGPSVSFPYAAERKYTPIDAPADRLFALRDHLGFSRNVIVQATCHGRDNSAMLDAISKSGGMARGVAVLDDTISRAELSALNMGGVRGVRFNFLKRLVGNAPIDRYIRVAKIIADLGWHIVLYFDSAELDDLTDFIQSLPGTIVIDHMGRPNVQNGIDSPEFSNVRRLMDDERFWIKTSCPERLSVNGPPYQDVEPFAAKLIADYPDRVLWGTDWPHPNMTSHMPDDGALVDMIPRIAPTRQAQQKLLVTNPMRLYWPEEAS